MESSVLWIAVCTVLLYDRREWGLSQSGPHWRLYGTVYPKSSPDPEASGENSMQHRDRVGCGTKNPSRGGAGLRTAFSTLLLLFRHVWDNPVPWHAMTRQGFALRNQQRGTI